MSEISDHLFVSNSNSQSTYCFGGCCDNQYCVDYPSPQSSPSTPEFNDISDNQTDMETNNYSLFGCNNNCCASPCSTTYSDDINIDLDTTSERSYTNIKSYTNPDINLHMEIPLSPVDSTYCSSPKKLNKKRSFSEVDDAQTFNSLDTMSEEEMDNYINNIDLDLFPKVKSSSELLIFSPLSLKRFKLSNKKSNGIESNYDCFNPKDDIDTPRIVEINDDEDINQSFDEDVNQNLSFDKTSSKFLRNLNSKIPCYDFDNSFIKSSISSNNSYCYSTSPFMSSCQHSMHYCNKLL